MLRKLLLTSFLTIAALGAAHAEDRTEKNGMPCVAEICIGDGIAELKQIPWEREKNLSNRKLTDSSLAFLRQTFQGDLSGAAPYLEARKFDGEALDSISRVSAACRKEALIGNYVSQGGNPTVVYIELTPNQGPVTTLKWTVTMISRKIPSAVTDQQKAEIQAGLAARYKAFDIRQRHKNIEAGDSNFEMQNTFSNFGFTLALYNGMAHYDRLKQHPLCGGGKKLTAD